MAPGKSEMWLMTVVRMIVSCSLCAIPYCVESLNGQDFHVTF